MEELMQLLGQEAAFAVMTRFGGVKLYIPQKPEDAHPLADLLGREVLCRLCQALGGTYLEVPRNQARLRQLQRQRIHQLRAERLTQAQIARKMGCTERWVRQVLKQYPLATTPEQPLGTPLQL